MAPNLIEVSRDPFEHYVLSEFYEADVAHAVNQWLSTAAPWKRSVHHFYDQFELNFKHVPGVPERIASALLSPAALRAVKRFAEELFETQLLPRVCLVAHKLVEGQGIGLHTDDAPGEETHRIVAQLSIGRQDAFGGHLVFFGSGDIADARRRFSHDFNTAIGFPLSHASYHAVSDVSSGERLTLIYGFWSASSEFDESVNAERTFALGEEDGA